MNNQTLIRENSARALGRIAVAERAEIRRSTLKEEPTLIRPNFCYGCGLREVVSGNYCESCQRPAQTPNYSIGKAVVMFVVALMGFSAICVILTLLQVLGW